MNLINIPEFINRYITKRKSSLLFDDIKLNSLKLNENIFGKSILVIGGAGTIGSSFIKEILVFRPNKLVVVDTNENALTELTRDLRSNNNQFVPVEYLTYPMDFGSETFYKMFVNNGTFNIVANFAAHKHVRSEKDKFSIESMIENNVFKAKKLLSFLIDYKPDHFFCVSTDKATNPVNIMGASKCLMEKVIMSYSNEFKITTARFANVAFSNGSLLAGYIERIFKNQPISCPSDVKRYFVSPEESGQICLLACILGSSGNIFFPKLKNLSSFKDITLDFFNQLNKEILICSSEKHAKAIANKMSSDDPYPVFFFKSDTSGEKLFEEFYTNNDNIDLNSFKKLGFIKMKKFSSINEIENIIKDLILVFESNNYSKSSIVSTIKKNITDFNHIETGKNLDQKM